MRHDRTLAQAGDGYLFAYHLKHQGSMRSHEESNPNGNSQHQSRGINARRRFHTGASLLTLVSVLLAAPDIAKAQTAWTGANSTDWTDAGNWTAGVPTSASNTTIGTSSPNSAVLGVSGAATSSIEVLEMSGSGNLTVQNGSTLTASPNAASSIKESGSLTVTGSGSVVNFGTSLSVGYYAAGVARLTISNGASVVVAAGQLAIANNGQGNLEISSGGTLTTNNGAGVGYNAGPAGTATVTGAGSTWNFTNGLSIGYVGNGTLTLSNGGRLNGDVIYITDPYGGPGTTSIGIWNIGAAPGDAAAAPGTAIAPNGVQFGAGTGTINFNHTSSNYVFSAPISGPLPGGTGTVNQIAGTTILTAVNTFEGPTNIIGGTLQVDGEITQSAVNVNTNGTLRGIGTLGGIVTNMGNVMPGDGGPGGALTVTGAYVGNGGRLTINSELGGDASPTSQLVLSGAGASATGNTNVVVNNAGGTGGQTSGSGIPIVVATGGATTIGGAFTLGGPVVAGLYQYQLFRGPDAGGTPDQQNSWFLRSHLDGPNPTPIYRPEGAIFAAMPSLGRELTRNTIGSFHDYNGDQGLVRGNGSSGRSWGRVFGEVIEQGHAGLLSPNFRGHAYGFQTGADLFESETPGGFIDRVGVFFGYAQARGEVRGFALGIQNNYVGDSSLEGLSGGAYWTRIGPSDQYLEARVVGTHYSGDGRSFENNMTVNVKGTSFAASLEGGYPIRFGGYTIEPQAQVIYQYLDMNGRDPMSSIGYDTPDALYARVGLRLSSDGLLGWSNVKPYLKANVWQDEVGTDKAAFSASDVVSTSFRTTAVEVGGGVVAQLNQYASVWGMMDYTTDVAGNQDREIIRGNVGMKLTW